MGTPLRRRKKEKRKAGCWGERGQRGDKEAPKAVRSMAQEKGGENALGKEHLHN